ncbi:protein-lysine N-methyltransferase EEF2KMT [Stegastes partitus]|uniref:Eukaryotic elongation factor 2 lysine methyltransferase n=1 Tax=Stegastes partitus TaxID=144197 RepID=A0A3B4ZZR1_9TELE|nr:PREDICTED: protein FAM86A [Stegastes partitus]
MEHSEQNQTSENGTLKAEDVLKDFQVSFFAMSRLPSFPWTFVQKDLQSNKSSEFISEILKQTCLHPLCRKFPPSVRFRRLFLLELIKLQEAADCDPLDELYDALGEVIGAEETSESYKSYLLPGGGAVSLLENVALISEGTTGLVTWEAALYLAEWALDHQQHFIGRTVLELGSGVGLTGITVCHCCSPNRFVFSDCHSTVLQKLRDNVRLNGLSDRTTPEVDVVQLDWTTATEEQLRQIGADTVIAADVVYDPDVAVSLVKLLSTILKCSSPEILICSTIRNPETYSGFKLQLEKAGISHQVMTDAVRQVFPYNRLSAIELIRLYR